MLISGRKQVKTVMVIDSEKLKKKSLKLDLLTVLFIFH